MIRVEDGGWGFVRQLAEVSNDQPAPETASLSLAALWDGEEESARVSALADRSTTRAFDQRAISKEMATSVATVVAQAAAPKNWPGVSQPRFRLRLHCEAVTGVARGWYFDGIDSSIADACEPARLIRDLDVKQPPAFVVSVAADLEACMERPADEWYAQTLVRAGACAHAGWLRGLQLGLVGGVFAGWSHTAAEGLSTQLLEMQERHLVALAVGYPVRSLAVSEPPRRSAEWSA